jgi:type III pantothenate kinase
MEQELGCSVYVIGTGGLSSILAAETTSIQKIEPLLTLEGLELLYRRTQDAPPPTMQV